jgi:hypothetical protein
MRQRKSTKVEPEALPAGDAVKPDRFARWDQFDDLEAWKRLGLLRKKAALGDEK